MAVMLDRLSGFVGLAMVAVAAFLLYSLNHAVGIVAGVVLLVIWFFAEDPDA